MTVCRQRRDESKPGDTSLLGSDSVTLGDEFPTFRRIVMALSSKDLTDCLTLRMKTQGSFETSAYVYNSKQHHDPEELVSQKRLCKKLKSRTVKHNYISSPLLNKEVTYTI